MPLFLLFLVVALIEIAMFIVIGGEIGVIATLAMVLVTAIAGSLLLRQQGIATLNRIRSELEQNRLPARPIADGAMIAVAGLLLLTPGFFTDFCGFLLFVPGVRSAIFSYLSSRITMVHAGSGGFGAGQAQHRGGTNRPGPDGGVTIDLDEDDFQSRPRSDSPWRPDSDRDN